MSTRLAGWFLVSAGVLLLITAVGKLVASGGNAPVLLTIDPITGLAFGTMFFVVGLLELIIAHACFAWTDIGWRAGAVAWLSTCILVYRLCLVWVGYHKPCGCLGSFTQALHLSPETADTIMKIVLGYLLVGSYACLWMCWKNRAPAGGSLGTATGNAA
jgi:hypothetical protein